MATSPGRVQDTALVAVFAALIAVFTALVPGVNVGPVPITLQTLAVALTGLILGPVRGALAVLLYLAVGFAGLPVFAQGNAGLGVFGGGSIGYLLSFPVAALLAGWIGRRFLEGNRRRLPVKLVASALVASVLVVHPAGVVGLVVNTSMSLGASALYDLRFWPGDLIKSSLAGVVAAAAHRAFPALGRRPAALAPAPAPAAP
jgi:biotin transport system substrate-specific component